MSLIGAPIREPRIAPVSRRCATRQTVAPAGLLDLPTEQISAACVLFPYFIEKIKPLISLSLDKKAFGSVEAMTDRVCIASKGQKKIHLSAEDVTSCCSLGDMGCNGGIPSTVYTYYKTAGIVDGGNYGDKSMCYSYQLQPCAHHSTSPHYKNCTGDEPTPSCAKKCVDNGASWSSSKHYGSGGYSVCQQGSGTNCAQAMMQEIYKNGPITGMFFVHQSFLSYKSGVYKAGFFFKDPMLGGHAIKILGWGTEKGTPYWLVARSVAFQGVRYSFEDIYVVFGALF